MVHALDMQVMDVLKEAGCRGTASGSFKLLALSR